MNEQQVACRNAIDAWLAIRRCHNDGRFELLVDDCKAYINDLECNITCWLLGIERWQSYE